MKDGGPAFPCKGRPEIGLPDTEGMTLRDWFAGQALVGMYSSCADGISPNPESLIMDAAIAYRIADAMLEERDK